MILPYMILSPCIFKMSFLFRLDLLTDKELKSLTTIPTIQAMLCVGSVSL